MQMKNAVPGAGAAFRSREILFCSGCAAREVGSLVGCVDEEQEMPPAARGSRGNIEVSPRPSGLPDPFSDQGIPLDPCELCVSFFRVAHVCCALSKTQKAINTSLRLTVDGFLLLVW